MFDIHGKNKNKQAPQAVKLALEQVPQPVHHVYCLLLVTSI